MGAMQTSEPTRFFDPASRPRLVPPRSTLEKALDALGVVALVLAGVVLVTYWPRFPETIPTHFDGSGRPDGWGGRATILLLGLLPYVTWVALTFLGRFPHRFNYPWTITAENADRQYLLSRTLLASVKVWAVLVLVHLLWRTSLVAVGEARTLGVAFLLVSLLVLFGILLVYFVQAYRARY